MTMEQFDKARELYYEKEFVAEVEDIFLNWTNSSGNPNKLTMIYGNNAHKSGEVYHQVDMCSEELRKRLLQTCRDYYDELVKQFEEV